MNSVPWLSVLWLVPLAGAVLAIVMPPEWRQPAKWFGVAVSLAVLAVSIVIALEFKTGGPTYQFVESHRWIPAFGAGYTIGVDGIALVLVLLTTILVPLLLVAGWNDGGDADDPLRPASPRWRSPLGNLASRDFADVPLYGCRSLRAGYWQSPLQREAPEQIRPIVTPGDRSCAPNSRPSSTR